MKTNLLIDFSVDRENNQIKVERAFEAPLPNVWAAWTQSEILDQWWAPKPWKARTKTMDFREGGYWLYAMVGPEGEEHWSRSDFKSISPKTSFSLIEGFCDGQGNMNNTLPVATWTNHFTENSGSTTVSILIQYDDFSQIEAILEMGFKEGFLSGMENLDEIFAGQ